MLHPVTALVYQSLIEWPAQCHPHYDKSALRQPQDLHQWWCEVEYEYRSHTLNQHVQRGWNFLRSDFNEFIELWPAQQQTGEDWYRGTADAVYQNFKMIDELDNDYVLILAGDHVYRQDYSVMLQEHIENDADVTVACIEVPIKEADQFGIMHVDENDNIIAFEEKPTNPPTMPGKPDVSLASMGMV